MISPNELRIGNWYYIANPMNSGERTAHKFAVWTDALDFEGYGEPTPLTEEWLIRFGLEKMDPATWKIADGILLRFPEVDNRWDVYRVTHPPFGGSGIRTIRYVHELQNIAHALTGEELTLKQ